MMDDSSRFEIDNTRKHFVSQFHLREFAIPNRPKQIYVLDKQRPEAGVFIRSIRDIEVSRYTDTVFNDRFLQKREDMWAKLIREAKGSLVRELNDFLRDREHSAGVRLWFATFIVESLIRSRGFRETQKAETQVMREQAQQFTNELVSSYIARYPEWEKELEILAALSSEMFGYDDERVFEALHSPPGLSGDEGMAMYKELADGSWRFDAASQGRSFITSDIPSTILALGSESQLRNFMWFIMPLTPQLVLTGEYGTARQASGLAIRTVEIGDKQMDAINGTAVRHSHRYLYGASEQELLRAWKRSQEN